MTTTRPTVRGFGGAVAAGHHLAAQIGAQMLASGGNAADAACAMGFALWVLEPTQNGPGGEVPILVRDARRDRVFAISGQGPAPAAATIERVRAEGFDLLPPDGLVSACVPGALDAWCRLLEEFGTRRLADVIAPARALAERGFPMYPFLRDLIALVAPRFERSWPTSAAIYLPVRAVGERQTNPPLARWLAELVRGGARGGWVARGGDPRRARLVLSRRGRGGDRPLRAHPGARRERREARRADHGGGSRELCGRGRRSARRSTTAARASGRPGPGDKARYFCNSCACSRASISPRWIPASADALHLWLETAKLAFADRDACYGDPRFADVPIETLLSRDYAAQRRALVDPEKASLELRPGIGRLPAGWPLVAEEDAVLPVEPGALAAAVAAARTDTTQCVAVDAEGNAVSATPSGGWIMTSPIVPELGFPLGTRLQMASLDPDHPNALAPGKRPRTTLSPSLAQLADGRWLAFGTPGGDQQDQWTSQFFLRLAAHGERDLQAAIDAPTVHSEHMPSSFWPRRARPGVVSVESRFDPAVLRALEARGHRLDRKGPWEHGRVLAATVDPSGGPHEAAASPRFAIAYAIALP